MEGKTVSRSGHLARKACYDAAVKDYYSDTYNNVFVNQYKALYQRFWLNTKRSAEWCEAWM